MYYIIIFLVICILISRVTFRIKNIKSDNDISLSFLYLFTLHFDYGKFEERVHEISSPRRLDISYFNQFIKGMFISRKFFDHLSSKTTIDKLYIYKLVNIKNKELDYLGNLTFLMTSDFIKSYIKNKFKRVNHYNYKIVRDDDGKNEFDFSFCVHISLYNLLYLIIIHFKTIIKMIKNTKSQKSIKEKKHI